MYASRSTACGVVLSVVATLADAQTTVPIAVTSSGVPTGQGHSIFDDISADGRFVVFEGNAALVANDTNGVSDIYLHDRANGSTVRISVGPGGVQANSASQFGSISADGRWIAFVSSASNLVGGDLNTVSDVFAYDTLNDAFQLVSVDSNGVQACCSFSAYRSWISGHGRHVVFSTSANLDPNDLNGMEDVYIRDLDLQLTERVSVDTSGGDPNGSSTPYWHSVSDDGRHVVFNSTASNLIANDTNGALDIFVRDRVSGVTERASLDSSGAQIANWSVSFPFPAISGNGRVVTWSSQVQTIVQPDVLGFDDVFLRDLNAGTTTKISVGMAGAEASGQSLVSTLSFDGNAVLFRSTATNIVPGVTPGFDHDYVHDRTAGTYRQVDVDTLGQQGFGGSFSTNDGLALSADGLVAGFSSSASKLVPLSINPRSIYVHDAATWAPVTLYCTAKVNSVGCTPGIGAPSFPSLSGYDAFFISAIGVRNQKSGLLFWGTTAAAIPFGGGTLCIAPPIVRTGVQSSFGSALPANNCTGIYTLHFGQAYMASQSISAGQTLRAQYWSRDPGFAPPDNIGLTDAVSFDVSP